jgi:hypothetical protein
VAEFETIAQNLLNHEQGPFGSTAAIWGRPRERRVSAPSVTAWGHRAFPELRLTLKKVPPALLGGIPAAQGLCLLG